MPKPTDADILYRILNDACLEEMCSCGYTPQPSEIKPLQTAYNAVTAQLRQTQMPRQTAEYEMEDGSIVQSPVNCVHLLALYLVGLEPHVVDLDSCAYLWAIARRVGTAQAVSLTRPREFKRPVDAVNRALFSYMDTGDYKVFVGRSRNRDVTTRLFVQLTGEPLTPFDMDVCIAVDGFWNSGNRVFTMSSLTNVLYRGEPSKNQILKIYRSFTKLMGTVIAIDNTAEHTAYKNRPLFIHHRNVVYAKQTSAIINGNWTDSAIELLDRPLSIRYAEEIKQVGIQNALYLPVNDTETNRAIHSYLLDMILRNKARNNLLWCGLIAKFGDPRNNHELRIKKTVRKIMDSFVKQGVISSWDETAKGIEWYRARKRRNSNKKTTTR